RCAAHPALHSFPTRRSSDLVLHMDHPIEAHALVGVVGFPGDPRACFRRQPVEKALQRRDDAVRTLVASIDDTTVDDDHLIRLPVDRKSTRLNSSHVKISYAV